LAAPIAAYRGIEEQIERLVETPVIGIPGVLLVGKIFLIVDEEV
jgi:hypothetical protein